jgi:hypothetical protein
VFDPRVVGENGSESVVGEAGHIAEALATWRDEGVAEVMCRLEPPSTSVVEEIVRATEISGVRGSPLEPD